VDTVPKQSAPVAASRVVGVGWGIYQHIAAVLGSLALAAMASQVVHLDWRSFLGAVVDQWDLYVRPAVQAILETLITKPLGWAFGWHFEVPLVLRDYLAVGTILALSMTRVLWTSVRERLGGFVVSFAFGLLWPLAIVAALFLLAIYGLARFLVAIGQDDGTTRQRITRPEARRSARQFLLVLAPVLYLGVLLLINYVIL
jgi:hypothetical protein